MKSQTHRVRRGLGSRTVAALAVGAMTLALASCSSDEETKEKGGSGAGVTVSDDEHPVDEAAEAFAKTRPTGLKLEPKTIGLVNVIRASTTAQRIEDAFVEAADKLGWEVKAVDAGGDPAKMASGMAALLNQNVDAIISLSNATGAISQQLAQAAEKDIPVFNVGGLQDEDPNLVYQYVIDDELQSKAGGEDMVKRMPDGGSVLVLEAPQLKSIRIRTEGALAALEGAGNFDITKKEFSLADLNGSITTTVNAALAADPNLTAIYVPVDSALPIIAQILSQRNLCEKVMLFGYYDSPQIVQGLRDGCITATVAVPANTAAYAAADQLALYFANGTEPVKDIATMEEQWGLELQNGPSTIVLDKTNLPESGDSVPTYYNVPKFFDIVWTSQFGELAN